MMGASASPKPALALRAEPASGLDAARCDPAREVQVSQPLQFAMFPMARPAPKEIVAKALSYNPVAKFALFSGGDDSLTTTHWCMANIPGCEVLHIVTGIGVEKTRLYVRETCDEMGWPLTELHAKDDCGQDYEAFVLEHGFPGPATHQYMYNRLKLRAIELIVRRRKTKRSDKVMLATGIRQDESQRRSGYGGREVNFTGAQMWVNPFYWVSQSEMHHYRVRHGLRRNPVSELLGMSGECLCGAFADKGELALVRRVDPATADRLEGLQIRVRAAGHNWGWEERPPRTAVASDAPNLFNPLCVSCLKSERDRDAAPRGREAAEAVGQQPGPKRSGGIAQ